MRAVRFRMLKSVFSFGRMRSPEVESADGFFGLYVTLACFRVETPLCGWVGASVVGATCTALHTPNC